LLDGSFVNDVEAIAEGGNEVLVMGDDHKTTFEVVQGDDQGIDRVEIKMVCRLIEQQNVRFLPGDDGETDSGLLTTGEEVHGTEGHVARDTEGAEMHAEPFCGFEGVLGHELFDGGLSEVELVHVMLSEH